MTFFTPADLGSFEGMRAAYRRLVMEFHPDKHHANEAEKWTELFKALQNEYDEVLQGISGEAYETERTSYAKEKTIQEKLEELMRIPGIVIDLCGCWLWITGDTFNAKDTLKALGFKWSKSKKSWCWGLTMTDRKKQRAKYSKLEDVYNAFGRESFKSADEVMSLG